jgi:hypothetical protein
MEFSCESPFSAPQIRPELFRGGQWLVQARAAVPDGYPRQRHRLAGLWLPGGLRVRQRSPRGTRPGTARQGRHEVRGSALRRIQQSRSRGGRGLRDHCRACSRLLALCGRRIYRRVSLALDRQICRGWLRVREDNFSLEGLVGRDLHGKTFFTREALAAIAQTTLQNIADLEAGSPDPARLVKAAIAIAPPRRVAA